MSNLPRSLAVVAAVSLALLGALGMSPPPSATGSAADPSPVDFEASFNGPLVVELFTSQGCSSCPPADRLLSRLAAADTNAEIIPLAYHVDYWNYIGWQDPFSSNTWSQRQQNYSRALGISRGYTPQLVVAGAADCVGSDAQQVDRLIATAKRRGQRGRVEIDLQPVADSPRWQTELSVSFNGPGPLDLMMAIVESGLITEVKRGENAKRTLHNDFVVRRLERVATLDDLAATWSSGPKDLDLDPGWSRENLRIVAFLQDPVGLKIHGAAVEHL